VLNGSLGLKELLGFVAYSDHLSLLPNDLLEETGEEVLVLWLLRQQLINLHDFIRLEDDFIWFISR